MEPFLNSGGAFRPQIVKVGALSAPTQEMLLKYCLDLSYIQNGSYLFLLFVKTQFITYYLLSLIPYSFYQRFLFQITA